jgi:hypothetical protein
MGPGRSRRFRVLALFAGAAIVLCLGGGAMLSGFRPAGLLAGAGVFAQLRERLPVAVLDLSQVTPAAPPTPTPPPPSVAATPTVRPGLFRSGGIGLTRDEWEGAHGQPAREIGGRVEYDGGRFLVSFRDGKIARVERVWGAGSPVLLDAARIESRGLLPRDARFVRTRVPEGESDQPFVDVYSSDSLPSRFPDAPWRANPWTGGQPGNTYAVFHLTPDLRALSSVVAADGG